MAGVKYSKETLNKTLLHIITLLKNNGIPDWFIGYGTLLGIVRGDSCIDQDDDVDIVCNIDCYDKIKEILVADGFKICYGYGINGSRRILKTIETDTYCSVDFYMAEVDDKGNFNDRWENVVWSECYNDGKLIEYKWCDNVLYLPNNYETKLVNRYGVDWRTPMDTKGPVPRKIVV